MSCIYDKRRTPLSNGRADREPLGGTAPRVADVLLEVADVAPEGPQSAPTPRLARPAQDQDELLQQRARTGHLRIHRQMRRLLLLVQRREGVRCYDREEET